MTSVPTSLYQYFDQHGVLIYVGITDRGTKRNWEHNTTKEWWPYVDRQAVTHFPDREAALDAERTLIRAHQPPFNKQHNVAHDDVLSAYLAFTAAPRMNAAALFHTLEKSSKGKRRLPLVPHDDAGRLAFRTHLEHAALAMSLYVKPRHKVRVTNNGRLSSLVEELRATGPLMLLVTHKRSLQPGDVVSAEAVVGWDNIKPQRAFLRSVQVKLSEDGESKLRSSWVPQSEAVS